MTEPEQPAEAKDERKSAATVLVEIAEELYTFGSSDSETFAVPIAGPKVVRLLRGGQGSLRAQLSREYYRRMGRAAPQSALADALLVIEGIAQDQEGDALHLRVGRHDGALWLDLGDNTGRAVRVCADGWVVRAQVPILFKRTALGAALPEPVHGGHLDELWSWLNVDESDRPLVAAWLVAVLFDAMPHPILGLFGEQGTGKTTAERLLVSLLDPSPVPTRKPPRDADSWVTAAAGSWVVGLDNLSDVPAWLSDSLCRAVTGDGDVRRKLYTDGELAVFAFRRCLILNGIDVGAMRGDLAERMLPIALDVIPDSRRAEEDELWPRWGRTHPRLLGAVLDLAASVLAVLPSVTLTRKPRMADFARILAAVDQVLATDGLTRYLTKQKEMAADSLSDDPFVTAIREALGDATFYGTSVELLTRVTPTEDGWREPKGWPGTPRKVTAALKRQAPPMRKSGWTVGHDEGANHDKKVRWTVTAPRPEMARNGDPRDPRDPHQQVSALPTRGSQPPDRGSRGSRDSETRTTPAPETRETRSISAVQDAAAGLAGLAGDEYSTSLADGQLTLGEDASRRYRPSHDVAAVEAVADHPRGDGITTCRACGADTKSWVLADRAGRCISCDQAHRTGKAS